MDIYTDPASGRSYTVDGATGRSRWLDQPPPPSLEQTQELPPVQGGPEGYPDGDVNKGWELQTPNRAGGAAMRALGTLVVLLVLAAALMLVLSNVRNGAPSGAGASPAPRASGKAKPSKQTVPVVATIGKRVRDGKFEFTITGTRTTKKLGNDLVNTTADGQFLLVSVTVRNVSDQGKTFVSIAQKLHDSQGREYTANPRAAIYLWEVKNLVEPIDPGETVRGTLVFDIPSQARADHVELHDSLLSGGVDVFLR